MYGGLTFHAGSRQRAFHIMDHLKYAVIASNIGDIRTPVIHPASTLYINSTREKQEEAGVFDDTIRVSIGIEDPDDLIEGFRSAVESADE